MARDVGSKAGGEGAGPAVPGPGMVAASSPHAARAGREVLAAGGNAVDAAIATALALTVADPVNISLFGRCQILGVKDGAAFAIDGASRIPAHVPDGRPGAVRAGFAAVPVPGLLPALARAHRLHGRIGLAAIVAPARRLAEEGFAIPPALGAIWREKGGALASDPGARAHYLKADGTSYGPGEHFRHPALARLLDALSHDLRALDGLRAERDALARRIADAGGFVTGDDLASDATGEGEILHGALAGNPVITIGRQGWGHSLLQMAAILDAGGFHPDEPGFAEHLALTLLCALADRPQELGSLTPKPFGLPLSILCDPDFARARAALICRQAGEPDIGARLAAAFGAPEGRADRDTTHLSVVDGDGNMVAMTSSIGPHFGAGVADPVHGVLFGYSYRMANAPQPGARDVTEMTPAIVGGVAAPRIAIGGAGSERIPGAVLQVLVGRLMRGMSLRDAVDAPRCNWLGGALRLHTGHDAWDHFRRRGYAIVESPRDHRRHLGIVQAVERDGGHCEGAADPAYDGAAA
ncbi:MAG: gamma-glutamyltransferase [Salinarimonas sp.]|nr:gamma-glutamyltransferase [Salinarimonas sp.]